MKAVDLIGSNGFTTSTLSPLSMAGVTENKLWLRIRLAGRVQLAFQKLSKAVTATAALKERFEPATLSNRYLSYNCRPKS